MAILSANNRIRSAGGKVIFTNDGDLVVPSVCGLPTSVNASAGTSNCAFTWVAGTGAQTYEIRYRVVGDGTWIDVTGITGTSYNLTGLTDGTAYEYQVRTNCGSGETSDWTDTSGFSTTSSSGVWNDTVAGATQVFDIYPALWPVGQISPNDFKNAFPNINQSKTFIDDARLERKTTPTGLDAIRIYDPVCRNGENRNPYYRRISWYNNGLDDDNLADAGLANGAEEVAVEFGMYFHPHSFSGGNQDKDEWSMGKHSKWIMGISGDLGFANTGGNVQPDGEFEVVFTHYGALIANNGKNAKGDFPYDGPGLPGTDWDYSGTYGPAYDTNDPSFYQNHGNMGLGVYSADTRHGYNYEEQIWPTFPGTNVRRTYTVGVYYEFRIVVKLDAQGQDDGRIYWEWREDGGAWETVADITGWRARGSSNIKIRRIGPLGMFNGGWGWGWSWGDTDYYPFTKSTSGGPTYDRGFYMTYFRAWGK